MKNQDGFTLIEVLVAFGVLSVSLAVLYFSFSSSFTRSSNISAEQRAMALGRNALAKLPVSGLLKPFQEKYETGGYVVQIAAPEQEGERNTVVPVTVVITWQGRTGEQELVLRTQRLLDEKNE